MAAQNNLKEKIVSLTKYVDDLKSRLNSNKVPERAKANPEPYKEWLRREIDMHTKKIEFLKG